MKTLLLDFSNIAHSTFYVVTSDKSIDSSNDPFSVLKIKYWKYLMLSAIQKQISIHRPNEFIVCVDSRSWRKKAFVYYKANRELARETSDFDYVQFFNSISDFVNDLKEYFQYKVLSVNYAEADDIIGVLVHYLKSKRDMIIIASNDKDMKQLIDDNVKLWNLTKKDWMTVSDPKQFLLKHILIGDPGDGIPNARSDDDVFINSDKRQKPCGEKTIVKILEQGLENWIKENKLQRNWNRNKKLIQLSPISIPRQVCEAIIKKYESLHDSSTNSIKILQYIRKNGFKLENYIDNFMIKNSDKKTVLEDFNF